MRCQTPSRYVSHAIVRLIGSALAASAPSTCGTMVEKRPLPISEEKRRETSLSLVSLFKILFSRKRRIKKVKIWLLPCTFIFRIYREIYTMSCRLSLFITFKHAIFCSSFRTLLSHRLSISRSSHGACLSLSVPAKNKWRRWAGGRSRSIIPAN